MQKGAQVGKNMEKEGFRENDPGHGCINKVIFTQVCKGKKTERIIITHNPCPKTKHLKLVFHIREVLLQFKREAEWLLVSSLSGNFLRFFFHYALLGINSNKFVYR